MILSFYMDVNIPAAITEALRRSGVDVLTSQEDGTREASDEELLNRSTALGRVLFSQDDDLLRIADEWQAAFKNFAGLVYAHQRGLSLGHCVKDLDLIAKCCSLSELKSQI
jgi:hypothetical protein